MWDLIITHTQAHTQERSGGAGVKGVAQRARMRHEHRQLHLYPRYQSQPIAIEGPGDSYPGWSEANNLMRWWEDVYTRADQERQPESGSVFQFVTERRMPNLCGPPLSLQVMFRGQDAGKGPGCQGPSSQCEILCTGTVCVLLGGDTLR